MSVILLIDGVDITLEILITVGGYQLTINRPREKVCPAKAPPGFLSLKDLKRVIKTEIIKFNLPPFFFLCTVSETLEHEHFPGL